ncbi:MAG: hypothetical protein HRT35_24105 [Algicola sp.]|nr:hypothetical protein [Algicola sp.]
MAVSAGAYANVNYDKASVGASKARNTGDFGLTPASAVAAAVAHATYAGGYAYIYDDVADDAVNIAATAAASYTAAAAGPLFATIESAVLQDLSTIQCKKLPQLSTKSYGKIWDNFLKALENEGCNYFSSLCQNIFDNPFVVDLEALERRLNVPEEIRSQGAAAVGNYLEALEVQGAERLNEARILILGEKGAGKTCIARRLIDPEAEMTTPAESTAGVDTTLWTLPDDNINVRIWDFAGHTVTHAVHQFFLSERCLYIVVYDGRTEQRNRMEYWLNHMQNYGGNSRAIILVNEQDQHTADIQINNLKEKYPIEAVHTFSIKNDKQKLELFREAVADYIRNNPCWNNQVIPKNNFKVKEDLEALFNKDGDEQGKEHITKSEFETIAKARGVINTEQLLKDLHALGVSLWYDEMEDFDTLVLNPEWISHGVYQIINWVNDQNTHVIKLSDFAAVFEKELKRFPVEQHKYLFSLMMHYELAYETQTNGSDEDRCLVIPHLLHQDRPADLPDFPVGESLMIQYKSELPLPPHTISRFIVRHNQAIKNDDLVWRYGVVLAGDNDSLALVREDDRMISVSVKGRGKTEFISDLRATLNDIFESYKSDRPELLYRVQRFGAIDDVMAENNPLLLSDRKILNHISANRPYFEDMTNRDIDLKPTVNQYHITAQTVMMGGQGSRFIQDNSTHFNFKECNIGLQGQLNELAQYLTENGNKEQAAQLENTAKALEQVEKCENKEELNKTGVGKRLERLMGDLSDKDSKLRKSVEGVKHGVGIAQDIAKSYNKIAEWALLPQVPKAFLKK